MLKNSSVCFTFSPSDTRQVYSGLRESHLASFSLHHGVSLHQNVDDTRRGPPLGTEWSVKVPMAERSLLALSVSTPAGQVHAKAFLCAAPPLSALHYLVNSPSQVS